MRVSRLAGVVAAALVATIALAGCGGHSGSPNSGGADPGASASPADATPLKVVWVKPHQLTATGTIRVRFAKTLSSATPLPTLTPNVPGTWSREGSTAVFTPSRAYPPDTTVAVSYVKKSGTTKTLATAATPSGSLLRAEQILARLHYLPLTTTAPIMTTAADEANAVYAPPTGTFSWRYSNTPSVLKHGWSAGKYGIVVRGAIIAFQHLHGLPIDGTIGVHTWRALIKADLADKVDRDHYSFVSANLYLPQRLSVWVDGKTVLTSPVNGGVAGAPTPLGTFPVYERFTSTTMQGTNPDGTKYKDPGVPWVNYFSGGSAVHGFPRASYGFPQSVGCLELPIPTAATIFKLIDYGTLVNVAGPFVKPPSVASPSPPSPSASPSSSSKPKPSPSSSAKPTPSSSKTHSNKPSH